MSIEAVQEIVAECERRTPETDTVLDRLLFLTSLQKWLAVKHGELFDEWLCSSLEEQYDMLAPRYREGAEAGPLPGSAFALAAYSKLIPAGGVKEPSRILFYSNLDLVLEILKEELALSEPSTRPPPAVARRIDDGLSQLMAV